MKQRSNSEKSQPFRLVKYFTFSSLVLIFISTVLIFFSNTHWIRALQYQKSEDYAQLLVENLNHQVFLQFILPIGLHYGKIDLRDDDQFKRIDNIVRSTFHSFKVDMVNIYGKYDIIAYSFKKELLGMEGKGGLLYEDALGGKTSSKLIKTGSVWKIFLGIPQEVKIVTFAPLRAEKPLLPLSGPAIAVVEVVQDLSKDYQKVFKFQILILITIGIVMGILLIVLIYIVERGEKIIEKRTSERMLLKDQLSKSKRLSALGEMVAGVSHEIRNPLGIISSSAELLMKRSKKGSSLAKISDIIVKESNRLNNIVTDFLDFARPKSPKLSICRIEDIILKNVTFFQVQAEKQKCIISVSFLGDLPKILVDLDMLYQAFLNIFLNAMQAMDKGGKIDVYIKSNKKTLTVLIEDEGSGIPNEIIEKIWDPFFTTKESGTGLGLGIIKNLIESNFGEIQLENREGQGKGVCVSVILPVYLEN